MSISRAGFRNTRGRCSFASVEDIDVTTTFKQKKLELVAAGFDPGKTTDPIYFNDPQRKAFVRLDLPLYEEIVAGRVRL